MSTATINEAQATNNKQNADALAQLMGHQENLVVRPRRLRSTANLRSMVRETHLRVDQLIAPFFIVEGSNRQVKIEPMPGVYQMSIDKALYEIESIAQKGIKAILLFGIPEHKDARSSSGWAANGVIQVAIKEIKNSLK